ncbi:MAG: hypothetical protein NTV23_15100 [Propionibacteriales bacterium]|nr:hypothetical protein [Propionibacteriales bacterium]
MSKERARRREEREAVAAANAVARERSSRKAARSRARKAAWTARFAWLGASRPGQQTGILAARRRLRLNLVVTFLILVQAVVWITREDWKSSLAALVVSALAFPVIVAFAL